MEDEALLLLGEDGPAIVSAIEGEALALKLIHADGVHVTWKARGGPPGLFVRPDGTLEYDLDEASVGRWWVDVQYGWGPIPRRTGFELQVLPESGEGLSEDTPLAAPPRQPLFAGLTRCGLGLGVTGGASVTLGSSWKHVGQPPVEGDASPTLMGQCAFGELFQPMLGLEVQPLLRISGLAQPVRGYVGIDAVRQAWTLGLLAFVDPGGALWAANQDLSPREGLGVGLRAQVSVLDHAGPELRVSWTDGIGGNASLSWWWTLDAGAARPASR